MYYEISTYLHLKTRSSSGSGSRQAKKKEKLKKIMFEELSMLGWRLILELERSF
jgi:hypothetical protein